MPEVKYRLGALPFPADLISLASIETCIVEKFNVSTFSELGNGSFLEFVAKHSQLKEELEGRFMGSAPQASSVRKKILRILSQLVQAVREKEVRFST